MTLRERISKEIGHNIKIGCKNGSNFMFCDIVAEDTEQTLLNIEQEEIQKNKRFLDESIKKYERLTEDGLDMYIFTETKRIEKENEKRKRSAGNNRAILLPIPPESVMEKKYYQTIENLGKLIKKYELWLSSEHPILDAEVVERYKSITADNTWICIIDGIVTGRYWDKQEYITGQIGEEENEERTE